MVVGYDPNVGIGEERERFWSDLCMLGDLNEWIRDRVRAGITGAFRVPGERKWEKSGQVLC